MKRRTLLKAAPVVAALAAKSLRAGGKAASPSDPPEPLQPIALLKPEVDGGKSVLAALKERKTIRDISPKKLPLQTLSNLLWAAFGVNREKGPFGQLGRTAASASNSQEIDVYVALPDGVYLYEAVEHRLTPIAATDVRPLAGNRGRRLGVDAPVRLIYVANLAKYNTAGFDEPGLHDPEVQKSYYNVATGLIAGNVYLFAASEGLAAWFHNCDKSALAEALKLRPEQRVLYAQTVGYPASKSL